MSEREINDLVKVNFSQEQIDEFAAAERQAVDLYNGAQLDQWLAFVPRLSEIRTAAMRGQNSKNRAYGNTLGILVRKLLPTFWDIVENRLHAEATHLLWLGEEAERMAALGEYRFGLSKAKLAALATPKAAREAASKVLKARELERQAKEARIGEDDTSVSEAMAAERAQDKDEPTATDKQLVAAFNKKFVGQLAALFIEAHQERASDLAKCIQSELKARRLELKEEARRAAKEIADR